MRVLTLVEAAVALGIGALGGVGLLYGTGELRTSSQLTQLRRDYDDAYTLELTRLEAERTGRLEQEEADRRREEAEAKARAEAEAAAKAREAESKAREEAEKNRLPAFGVFTVKAASDLELEAGARTERGRSIELGWEAAPGKFKIKGGKFTINLTPKVAGNRLLLDVAVSPMAIVVADGERKGVSTAQGLPVGKLLKLDFQSPAAGDLNLILQYRK